ncbi:hypothetical protein L0F63_001757 [Massospora cicadina]|nr:hypothetical protein L0F63_001757 [Massospora cicadina]
MAFKLARCTVAASPCSLANPQPAKLLAQFIRDDFGQVIKLYHDTIASGAGVGIAERCLLVSSALVYANYFWADRILNECVQFWVAGGGLAQSASVSFRSCETTARYFLARGHPLMGHYLLRNLPRHNAWSAGTRVKLLRVQILNGWLDSAAANLRELVIRHGYRDPYPFDRLLFRTRFFDSRVFMQLIGLGFAHKIPMAPGYVNSAIYDQAYKADISHGPDVPEVFKPPPAPRKRPPPKFKLPIEGVLDWAVQLAEAGYPILDKGAAAGLSAYRALRRRVKVGANAIIYGQIVHGFVAARDLRNAELVYAEMLGENVAANPIVHGALLNGYVKLKDIGRVRRHLAHHPGVGLDLITTTMLINLAVTTSASMDLAEQLYANYVRVGGVPDHHLLGAMLVGYHLHGDRVGSRRVLEEMERLNLEPDLFMLNVLLGMAAREMDMEKVLLVLGQTVGRGLRPDLRTYHLLMDLLGAQNRVDQVESLFATLQSQRLSPTLYTFNSLILGYLRAAQPGKAFEAYRKLKACGLRPSAFTLGLLFAAISEFHLFHLAESLFTDLQRYNIDRSHAVLKARFAEFQASITTPTKARPSVQLSAVSVGEMASRRLYFGVTTTKPYVRISGLEDPFVPFGLKLTGSAGHQLPSSGQPSR